MQMNILLKILPGVYNLWTEFLVMKMIITSNYSSIRGSKAAELHAYMLLDNTNNYVDVGITRKQVFSWDKLYRFQYWRHHYVAKQVGLFW